MAWKRYPSVLDEVTAYVRIPAQRARLYKSNSWDNTLSFSFPKSACEMMTVPALWCSDAAEAAVLAGKHGLCE